MIDRKTSRFISNVIYVFKRDYGYPITFYEVLTSTVDYETGHQASRIESIIVPLAVVLPEEVARKFNNKAISTQYQFGAVYDNNIKTLLVDQRDLGDFIITTTGYFVYEGARWNITKIIEYDYKTAFIIIGEHVPGAPIHTITEATVDTDITINPTVTE
jgi:hypothetical protein